MGIIVSRYMDPASSEGALVKFVVDSMRLVQTVCAAEPSAYPDLTPWNVINFRPVDDLPLHLRILPPLQSTGEASCAQRETDLLYQVPNRVWPTDFAV